MFDISEFLKLSVPAAIFLVPVVMALVTGLGETFPVVNGRWQFLASLALGLLLGGPLFWVLTEPVTPGGWLAVVLFGLTCGLTASGRYNTQRSAAEKGSSIAADKETADWAAAYMDLDNDDDEDSDDELQDSPQ